MAALSTPQKNLLDAAHKLAEVSDHGLLVSGNTYRTAIALENKGLGTVRYQGPSLGWFTATPHDVIYDRLMAEGKRAEADAYADAHGAQGAEEATPPAPRFEVIRNEWDGNGGFYVEVRDNLRAIATAQTIRRARDAAKRAVTKPELVRWSRHTGRHITEATGHLRMVYSFKVSRLDPSYR